MKRTVLPLLVAALMCLTACQKEVDFVKKDYLPVVHSAVGMTKAQAEKVMKKEKFVYNESKSKASSLVYEAASKDSTQQLVVTYGVENDSVKTYTVVATVAGQAKLAQACAVYSDWSRYAYNTIFADISLWGGYVDYGYVVTDEEEGAQEKMYIDGNWAAIIKLMVEAYHASGEMDDDVYNMLIPAFQNKRADFEQVLNESGYITNYLPNEMFFHSTSTLDLSNMSSAMQSLQGNSGMLLSGKDEESGEWVVYFSFNGQSGLMDFLQQLM